MFAASIFDIDRNQLTHLTQLKLEMPSVNRQIDRIDTILSHLLFFSFLSFSFVGILSVIHFFEYLI